ncbi:MAG TPA: alpha/beta fold hydrolase [Thermoanaerobaculia bacterium]|nr:alpha/beta fold hydrolase [Thermoanaerobaculia bacterium]
MALDLLPHLWTLGPRLRHAVRPRLAPESRPWETVVNDPEAGPVRLTGWLRDLPGDDLLVLVHGLGGGTDSHYMVRGAAAAEKAGLSCLRFYLRGADRLGEDYYHAGLTADLHAALASPEAARYRRIYLLGYSLGGHVVLRLATETADPRLVAVAAVCSPVDLALSVREIDSPGFGLYRRYLLRSLADIYRAVAARRPVPHPAEQAGEIRLMREWDDRIVAPRHGFADAADYYTRMSVAPLLPDLRVPALLLNSECDPMVPARAVRPALERASPRLRVDWVRGGHVAFPQGMDSEVIDWLRAQP